MCTNEIEQKKVKQTPAKLKLHVNEKEIRVPKCMDRYFKLK